MKFSSIMFSKNKKILKLNGLISTNLKFHTLRIGDFVLNPSFVQISEHQNVYIFGALIF